MRSQTLLRNSRSLFKASVLTHPVLCSSPRPPRPSRKEHSVRTPSRVYRKHLSTSTSSSATEPGIPPSVPSSDAPESSGGSSDAPELPDDEQDKPKQRRTRVSTAATKDSDPVQLPDGLSILWMPEVDHSEPELSQSTALPPPEIFEEVLNNLHITLHPQTQHRASYASPVLIEPTLALYCPIEGGEYVIDSTVRELARQTGAEVLVLDAVQLAAGEWGQFGKAANSLQLPRNPLHFPSSSPQSASTNPRSFLMQDEDDSDAPTQILTPNHQMTLVMSPPTLQGRTLMASPVRRNPPPSKVKVFFDTLVNMPLKLQEPSDTSPPSRSKPRLVYIRDFPTLAPTSPAWYPPLLSAVRQRRRGPMSRPTSPIANPMTIIFGMTPSLTPPLPQSPSSGSSSSLGHLLNRNSPSSQVTSVSKQGKSDWSEDEGAEKAREKRLRHRLRKWERGDAALYGEFSKLSTSQEGDSGGEHRPEILIIGSPNGISGFPPMFGTGIPEGTGNRGPESEANSLFFRTSILVPSVRSLSEERACRVARRREINELTMRMGVGAVGGVLEKNDAAVELSESPFEIDDSASSPSDHERMWDVWGKTVEVWSNVRQIADRAVGSVIAARRSSSKPEKATLDSTAVTWLAVHRSWAAHRSAHDRRKMWMKETSPSSKAVREQEEEDEDEEFEVEREVDEVVERLKNESDLDSHESRLLPCIVDSASMPTSFSQVHLPAHTIDSVRTIVSLPLLHPAAFQQGILKEHGMTGCLLFGPPGTGKTLVVRALAKEAGCRMMAISPSDVMDMYVGEGEKLVKAVFSLARRLSPCVVFLDEIDALFGARMSARESGGAFAHRGVITEFMQEMDGLKSSRDDSVIVIGATNRPFDLDDAVLRRMPRRLLVDLPGEKEREEILKILLHDEVLALDLDIKALAKITEGFSGSDLKHLCVSAALDAVKEIVTVPWAASSSNSTSPPMALPADTEAPKGPTTEAAELIPPPIVDPLMSPSSKDYLRTPPNTHSRTLYLRNFTKALKEITPSSSEASGSLVELRKWNEEFGEGRKERKRQYVWGRGRFGFTDKTNNASEDGRVVPTLVNPSSSNRD